MLFELFGVHNPLSMGTVCLHTAVFGKWANRTYYHTTYLTQPRALPNWLGLVSCAEKTAILGRVCKFLYPRVTTAALWLYSTAPMKIQNGILEATETALISSERNKEAEYLNWMIVHIKLYFHITLNEQYFTKFQKPLKFGFTEMTFSDTAPSRFGPCKRSFMNGLDDYNHTQWNKVLGCAPTRKLTASSWNTINGNKTLKICLHANLSIVWKVTTSRSII